MSMRMIRRFSLLAAALVAGCDNATDASEVGELRTAIIAGGNQVTIAGAPRLPSSVIGQAQRVPLGASLVVGSGANATQTVRGLANVVMCVGEDQLDLIPFTRCVNTDTAGKAIFTFSPTTKAGTYRAKINFTLGAQESTIDSAIVTVLPDAFFSSPLQTGTSWPGRSEPASFPADVAVDKFGNPVPYRLVILPSLYAQLSLPPNGLYAVRPAGQIFARAQNDTLGSIGARTIVIDSIIGPASIEGADVGRVRALVQVVTASGISATGVLVTERFGVQGKRGIGLHALSCAIESSSCAY